MFNHSYLKFINKIFLCFLFINSVSISVWSQETVQVNNSDLVGVKLPSNALVVTKGNVPTEVDEALGKMVKSGGDKIRQGETEVLAWTKNYKKSDAQNLVKQLIGNLQTTGWKYEVGGENKGVTIFSVLRDSPNKRAIIGFYTFSDDAFVWAWTELLAVNSGNQQISINNSRSDNNSKISAAKILDVGKDEDFVNVMGNEMPAIPKFSALSPKAGVVRGYVTDWTGKPLAGATIGVRSSYLAGLYSGSQGKTDAKGFYEFSVPKGMAHFYNAGYQLEWGDGLAALGLHPADGKLDSFIATDGAVENFVLLPYGITSRENAQENPRLASSYYGGSLYIGYSAFEKSDNYPPNYAIAEDSTIEITLTPEDVAGQSFVIRKKAGFQSGFKINNIPLGRYQIAAKANGKLLKMKLNKPRGTPFGMTPNETSGTATILFAANGAKAEMVAPQTGGWDSVDISVTRP